MIEFMINSAERRSWATRSRLEAIAKTGKKSSTFWLAIRIPRIIFRFELAQRFVSDNPLPRLWSDRMAQTFLRNGRRYS